MKRRGRLSSSLGLLILLLGSSLSCDNADHESINTVKEKREKDRQLALIEYPLSDNAIELMLDTVFPGEDSKAGSLIAPFCVSRNEDNDLFVSDRVRNDVSIFSLQGTLIGTFGGQGNGPGDLSSPLQIAEGPEGTQAIYDSGNSRIQIFKERLYSFSFKLFNPCLALAVDRTGSIYTSLYRADSHSPLIDVFARDGRLLRQFGSRLGANTPLFNNVDMAISDGTLYVIWRTYPKVIGLTTDGRSIFEHLIDYGQLRSNGEYNRTAVKVGPAVSFRPVLWRIRPFQAGYRLLLNYPRLTILEINAKGIITQIYWKDTPQGVFVSDFLFLDDHQGKRIYTVETGSQARIAVYRPKNIKDSGLESRQP
jgi:hypothetical protein